MTAITTTDDGRAKESGARVTYGPTAMVIAGTYPSYVDAERIRDELALMEEPLPGLQVGALGVGRTRAPKDPRAQRQAVLTAMTPIALSCLVAALVASGLAWSSLLWGCVAGVVVGGAMIAIKAVRTRRAVPADRVTASTWIVLRSDHSPTR
jgi:hypothetical protein